MHGKIPNFIDAWKITGAQEECPVRLFAYKNAADDILPLD